MNRLIRLEDKALFLFVIVTIFQAIACHPKLEAGQVSAIKVQVSKNIQNHGVTYQYRIINNTKKEIASINIGYNEKAAEPELSILPLGWEFFSGDKAGSIYSPVGWKGRVITQEESSKHWIQWESLGSVPPSWAEQVLEGFSVLVSKVDEPYSTGRFKVIFKDSSSSEGVIAES